MIETLFTPFKRTSVRQAAILYCRLLFYLFLAVSLSFSSVSSLKKAAMTHEELPFTVPLLEDDTKDVLGSKVEDLDPNSAHHTDTSSSTVNVFRTCFNGLNALSGSLYFLPLLLFPTTLSYLSA